MSRPARGLLVFGAFIAVVGATFYPIYFRPLMQVEEYRKEQAINRAGIIQEDVQPTDMSKPKYNEDQIAFWGHIQPAGLMLDTHVLSSPWFECGIKSMV